MEMDRSKLLNPLPVVENQTLLKLIILQFNY